MAIFGLEHSTFDPKGGSLSGGEKAQYELRLGRWSERTDLIYSEVANLTSPTAMPSHSSPLPTTTNV